MRVFLDTNVLVSAFVSRGLCCDLLRIVLEEHQGLVSQLVLDEFGRVLRDKLRAPEPTIQRAMRVFDHVEVVATPTGVPAEIGLDPADAAIVAAAVASQADLFVTGDRKLLSAAREISVPVVSPRRFIELVRAPAQPYPDRAEDDGDSRVSERVPDALQDRFFEFAVSITGLCRSLEEHGATELARRVFRAGAGAGLDLQEAAVERSRSNAAAKTASAAQKARETTYWLRLAGRAGVVSETEVTPLRDAADELVRLLSDSLDTTYAKSRRNT